MLLLKTQIGLGVLALPNVMMTLGIVPALIVIILLGLLTTWGDYGTLPLCLSGDFASTGADYEEFLRSAVLGQFRDRYPGVHSAPDVGFISTSDLLLLRCARDADR